MAKDRGAHIAAPESFQYEGEDYILSPLKLADLKELEKYLRRLPVEEIKSELETLAPEHQRILLEKAYDRGAAIRIGNLAFSTESQGIDGITYMMWLSLRKTRPKMKLDDVTPIIESNVQEMTDKVNAAAGYAEDENPTAPAAEVAPAKKTKRTTRSISSGSIAT